MLFHDCNWKSDKVELGMSRNFYLCISKFYHYIPVHQKMFVGILPACLFLGAGLAKVTYDADGSISARCTSLWSGNCIPVCQIHTHTQTQTHTHTHIPTHIYIHPVYTHPEPKAQLAQSGTEYLHKAGDSLFGTRTWTCNKWCTCRIEVRV